MFIYIQCTHEGRSNRSEFPGNVAKGALESILVDLQSI